MRKARLVLALLVLSSLLMSSFTLVGAQDQEVLMVSIMGQDDIRSIDPSIAEDVAGIQVINMTMPGMTILNETTVMVEPGIAESWEVSDDGAVYTFHLRQDVTWVRYNADSGEVEQVTDDAGNVRMVTAHDVVYGIRRSLNPATLSYYGAVLATWIVGGTDMINLEMAEDGTIDAAALDAAIANLGVTAVDDYTVQITAPGNYPFLTNIYGMWMARPQPQWAIEAHGDTWTEPENINSYGPYALKEWAHDESISFIKNPFWVPTEYIPEPQIEEITNVFLELPAAVANFEAGELHYVNPVNPDDVPRVQVEYAEEFGRGPGQCTQYYGFNTAKAPFDNVHMRRAFSLALDRDVLDDLVNRGDVAAAFFTRPDLVAAPQQANSEIAQQFLVDAEIRHEQARQELQAYLDETGQTLEDLPPITLVYNESAQHALIAEVAQQMWNEVLGVSVQLASQEFGTLQDLRLTDPPQIFRAAWCFDYPDTNNYLYDVARSDSANGPDGGNEYVWVNETFDQLLRDALATSDVEERRALYQQAEEILVWEDAVMIPMFYYGTTFLQSAEVTGPFTNTGLESFEKWSFNN